MAELLIAISFLLNRYVHIVAMTLLVGGTLFYEMVLPISIFDLKSEQQLLVVGRARWAFRRIVLLCAAFLLVSGVVSIYRNWNAYSGDERAMFGAVVSTAQSVKIEGLAPWQNPRTWMIGHAILGAAGLAIMVSLVIGKRPPERPVRWMRVSLILLLVTIFLGSATRNARLHAMEMLSVDGNSSVRLILVPNPELDSATTQPGPATAKSASAPTTSGN